MNDQMPEMGTPEGGPEDFEGLSAPVSAGDMARHNLSEAWKTRPMFRFMVIVMPVVVVAAIALAMFGGSNDAVAPLPSSGLRTSDIALNPAIPTTPEVKQSVEQYDSQKIDQALATGNSAIATPMRTEDVSPISVESAADPLAEWRGASETSLDYMTDDMLMQDQQALPQARQVNVEAQQRRQQENDQLAQAMQAQMGTLLSAWVPKGAKVTVVEDTQKAATVQAAAAQAAQQQAPAAAEGRLNTLAMAGDVVYAQVLTQSNSDVPGPVLANILTGKLKGARVLGNFEYTEEYLVLHFSTAVLGNLEYKIDAIALDPDTTLTGVATDVDNHYFKRIVLPAAGAFISGFASARAQTATSSTTTSGGQVIQDTNKPTDEEQVYKGIEEAASKIQNVLDAAGNVRPTVVLAANTPVGILFLQSVREIVK